MKKEISFFLINKIKNLKLKIFEAEDDDYPNRKKITICERYIEYGLNKYKIPKSLHNELLDNINGYGDNCSEKLEKLGWIIKGVK